MFLYAQAFSDATVKPGWGKIVQLSVPEFLISTIERDELRPLRVSNRHSLLRRTRAVQASRIAALVRRMLSVEAAHQK